MKLINTFLTCSGEIGKQWRIPAPGNIFHTITVWKDKGRIRVSTLFDRDMKHADEARRKYAA